MLAYFDCFSGISGDMTLGALLDAGLSLDHLRAQLARLPVGGYTLRAEAVTDKGLRGTRVSVDLDPTVPQPQRHLADVLDIGSGESAIPVGICLNCRIGFWQSYSYGCFCLLGCRSRSREAARCNASDGKNCGEKNGTVGSSRTHRLRGLSQSPQSPRQ